MDKVNQLCHEDVECSRLRDLALGVIINESTEFENNPSPINFRMLHTKILNTCKVVEKRQRSVVTVEGCPNRDRGVITLLRSALDVKVEQQRWAYVR